jgi:hypothetical protein
MTTQSIAGGQRLLPWGSRLTCGNANSQKGGRNSGSVDADEGASVGGVLPSDPRMGRNGCNDKGGHRKYSFSAGKKKKEKKKASRWRCK